MNPVSEVLIVAGGAWSLLAAVGLLKFDDVFSRMHAGTKATTLGVALVTAGAALDFGGVTAAKLLLAVVLAYLTIPVGAHLVARSTYHHRGQARIRIDTVDELAGSDIEGGH